MYLLRCGLAWFNQRIPLGGKNPTRLVPFLSYVSFAVYLHLYDRGSRPFEVPYHVLVGLVLRGRAFSLFEGLGANRVVGHLRMPRLAVLWSSPAKALSVLDRCLLFSPLPCPHGQEHTA